MVLHAPTWAGSMIVGYQDWRDLLFIHWRVPAAEIAPLVHPRLSVDERDGTGWVSMTPFTRRNWPLRVRPRAVLGRGRGRRRAERGCFGRRGDAPARSPSHLPMVPCRRGGVRALPTRVALRMYGRHPFSTDGGRATLELVPCIRLR